MTDGVLNVIKDRALYDEAVALGLFPKGKGRWLDKEGKEYDWRLRPEVIALKPTQGVQTRIDRLAAIWEGMHGDTQ